MKVIFPNVQFKMYEKFEFESKNENEKGKKITGYFLTFVDSFGEKMVLSAGKDFQDFDNKFCDVVVDITYREYQGKKGFKLKVENLSLAKNPDLGVDLKNA